MKGKPAFKMPDGLGYPNIDGPRIKVRAIDKGEYEYARRYPGDVFELKPRMIACINPKDCKPIIENGEVKMRLLTAEDQFSSRWMERVEDYEDETITSAQEYLTNQTNEILASRRPGRPRKDAVI